jgi:hypothetical protein
VAEKHVPIMFYEIAEGEMAQLCQQDFVKAQEICASRGVKVKLNIEITIHPESREHPGTTQVEFTSQVKAPKRASIKYVAEVNREGQMVDSGIRQGLLFEKNQGSKNAASAGEGEE